MGCIITLVAGLTAGFLGSVPPAGPVSVMVLARSLDGRHREARGIALGGALGEGVWAGLAASAWRLLLAAHPGLGGWVGAAGCAALMTLGAWFLLGEPSPARTARAAGGMVRGGGYSGIALGVGLAASNPIPLLSWSAVAAALRSLGMLDGLGGPVALAFGAAVGIWLWLELLRSLVSHSGRAGVVRWSRTLRFGTGLVLLAAAASAALRALP